MLKPLKVQFIIVHRDPCFTGDRIEHDFIAHVYSGPGTATNPLEPCFHFLDHLLPFKTLIDRLYNSEHASFT